MPVANTTYNAVFRNGGAYSCCHRAETSRKSSVSGALRPDIPQHALKKRPKHLNDIQEDIILSPTFSVLLGTVEVQNLCNIKIIRKIRGLLEREGLYVY